MAFPILENNPAGINDTPSNNTIRSQFEGGYVQTRERHTRDLKTLDVTYDVLSENDKNLLEAHYQSVRGTTAFNFTNARTGTTYSVRYREPVSIPYNGKRFGYYGITLKMEVV